MPARRRDLGTGDACAQSRLGVDDAREEQQQADTRAKVQAPSLYHERGRTRSEIDRSQNCANDDGRASPRDQCQQQANQRSHAAVHDGDDDCSHPASSNIASIVVTSTSPRHP